MIFAVRPVLSIAIFCSLFFFTQQTKAQNPDPALDRLVAFARLAGDIRYFSPTDLADSMKLDLGWENIMWNGTKMARHAVSERAFADSLVRLFKPIDPSLSMCFDNLKLTQAPPVEEKTLVVGVQHIGLELLSGAHTSFKSIRTNRHSLVSDFYTTDYTIVRIRVPEGMKGKPFEIGFSHDASRDATLRVFKKYKFQRPIHLYKDSTHFVLQDSMPAHATLFAIKIRFGDHLPFRSISTDSTITIDGTLFKIADLQDLDATADVDALELRTTEVDEKLYERQNNIGDTLTIHLTKNITASFPLAVYADKQHTYPISDTRLSDYPYNKGIIHGFYDTDLLADLDVRLSNVMTIWNVFRHAYVYNTLDEESENTFLRETLGEVLQANDPHEYDLILRKMIHTYQDAHIFYSNASTDADYARTVPLTLIHIDKEFYIKRIHDRALDTVLQVGDRLLSIDRDPIKDRWQKQRFFATGSEANIINRAGVFGLLNGREGSVAELTFENPQTEKVNTVQVKRDYIHPDPYLYTSFLERRDNRMLNDSTYYFNLSDNPLTDTLLQFINDPSKHIVFELRGYLTRDSEEKQLLNRLIRDTIIQNNLFAYHILSPYNKRFVSSPLVTTPLDNKPKARFYFLVSESTQSAPETFLDVIKYWQIGTLIGKHTAGANGNINYLSMPGDIHLTFSGIKVLNSDGTQHHLQGIPPDFEVDYTLDDVLARRDPYIAKALEIIAYSKAVE